MSEAHLPPNYSMTTRTMPKALTCEKFIPSQGEPGEAVDLSYHLSKLSRQRTPFPLKGLYKYIGKPGMIALAGGLPSPAYFPFNSISADVLIPESFSTSASSEHKGPFSWIWALFSNRKDSTSPISILKYPKDPADLNLATVLQYGSTSGQPQLKQVIHEFTRTVYKPAYSNFTTITHTGNTDGWSKAFLTLCNPGEGVFTSAWTYPNAMSSMLPHGSSPVPVAMDGQGMRSDSLRSILAGWDEVARKMPRPHVMYIVPVGQNPTGATMLAQRKKEIYDICVEFDIIIVEDDPYYFLQEGPYTPPSERSGKSDHSALDDSDEKYIASLSPSFLSFDYQGRVIRLDTFSKTVAPGCRLGWFTCNPIFAEKLEREAEGSTNAPCGFGQAFVTALLLEWQPKGYIRWLKGLGAEYTRRRNFFLDCLVDNFHLEPGTSSKNGFKGFDVYFASISNNKEKGYTQGPIFSFVAPTAGMFVWLQFHFDSHSDVTKLEEKTLERRLWIALAEAGVLFGPGEIFAADAAEGEVDSSAHFRVSFSNAEYSDLKKAVEIFASVVKDFFKNP